MDYELEYLKYRNFKRIGGEFDFKRGEDGYMKFMPVLPTPDESAALGDQPTPEPEKLLKQIMTAGPDAIRNGLNKANEKTFDIVESALVSNGIDKKAASKIMKSIRGGQEEIVNFAYEMIVPQSPEDVALITAMGPVAKARKPAAAIAGALFGAGTTETQADKVGQE
jgi:hypothetical protein